VAIAFLYLAFRALLGVLLRFRRLDAKDVELLVLRPYPLKRSATLMTVL
jgi:hypothetical protein